MRSQTSTARRLGGVMFALVIGSSIASAQVTPQGGLTAPALDQVYTKAKTGDVAAIDGLRAEATAGNKNAQLMIGNLFANGTGVARDYKQALPWFTKAAQQGVSEAQYNLGQMYRNGSGVAADAKIAAAWYGKAADQGNASAMFNLGGMYLEGRGVPQSEAEARRLFQKAAALGHQGAQRILKQL